jgi:hypothetical protein
LGLNLKLQQMRGLAEVLANELKEAQNAFAEAERL